MDLNWCIENIELAEEYFKDIQNEHSELAKDLDNQRKNKKELNELYWKIRGLIDQFDKYYKEAVATKNEFGNIEDEHTKGTVSEDKAIQRKGQLTKKLTESFQGLLDYHEKIKLSQPREESDKDREKRKQGDIELAISLGKIKEPCEKEREKIRRERDIAKSEYQELKDQRDAILCELDEQTIETLKSKGIINIKI